MVGQHTKHWCQCCECKATSTLSPTPFIYRPPPALLFFLFLLLFLTPTHWLTASSHHQSHESLHLLVHIRIPIPSTTHDPTYVNQPTRNGQSQGSRQWFHVSTPWSTHTAHCSHSRPTLMNCTPFLRTWSPGVFTTILSPCFPNV